MGGKIKKIIMPEDVVINSSKGSKVPDPHEATGIETSGRQL